MTTVFDRVATITLFAALLAAVAGGCGDDTPAMDMAAPAETCQPPGRPTRPTQTPNMRFPQFQYQVA